MFGQTYDGMTGSHMDNKIYLYGLHEPATIRLMRAILKHQKAAGSTPVFMDAGTNTGMFLTALSDLTDKSYGFEPWDTVRTRAMNNLKINKMNHVTVFDFGLSDEDATLPFIPPENNNLGVGIFATDNAAIANISAKNPETLELPVRRGDIVVKDHNIHPTLIKLDIEGYEKKALRGLKDTLKTYRPAVIFEYSATSRQDFDSIATLKELFDTKYSFYGILPSREYPRLQPFTPGHRYENLLAWPDQSVSILKIL